MSDPLVAECIDDLITIRGGEPLKRWKNRVTTVESVCKVCGVEPSDLIMSQRNTEDELNIIEINGKQVNVECFHPFSPHSLTVNNDSSHHIMYDWTILK